MAVYLLCLDRPVCDHRPARRYLGYAAHVPARIAQHRAGQGAKMLRAAVERGIDFQVARVWPNGDRTWERRLKARKEAGQLCPICAGVAALHRGVQPATSQLVLPLDDDIPAVPVEVLRAGMDSYEFLILRSQRAGRVPVPASGHLDDDLL